MRVKPIPEPPADLETVAEAHRAIPLVPAGEQECVDRLARRLGLAAPDVARTWLTFLRGLGLVREGQRGFSRVRRETDREALAAAVEAGVFGAREVLDSLSDEPRTAGEIFGDFEPHVPEWERAKHPGAWRGNWEDRTERLLDWLVLVGLAERADAGYRAGTDR